MILIWFPVLQLIIIAFCYLQVNNISHGEFNSSDYLSYMCLNAWLNLPSHLNLDPVMPFN